MQYYILEGDQHTLSQKVNIWITDGWKPYGQPYTMNNAHFQAMTFTDKSPATKTTNTPPAKPLTKKTK